MELDGEDHYWDEGIKHDNTWNLFLHKKEIRVLRFENKWVFKDIDYVLLEIRNEFVENDINPILNS